MRNSDVNLHPLPLEAVLARDILTRSVGDRLPTVPDYQKMLDIGSGTFQKALRALKDAGALTVRSHGHKGTFIQALHLHELWAAAMLPPLHLLMPPVGSQESRGLAGALAAVAREGAGATITLGFRGGARSRLAQLKSGKADLIVMSSGALSAIIGPTEQGTHHVDDKSELVVLTLGPGSYYAPGSIVIVARHEDRGRWHRIGVDPQSSDHQMLSAREFADLSREQVDTEFPLIPRAVAEGAIDAGIWHRSSTLIPLSKAGLHTLALSPGEPLTAFDQVSAATIIARSNSPAGKILQMMNPLTLAEKVTSGVYDASFPDFLVEPSPR